MNAKTAKRCRQLARRISHGWPDRQLIVKGTNRTTAMNAPKTTRGVYKQIKGWLRSGQTLDAILAKIAQVAEATGTKNPVATSDGR